MRSADDLECQIQFCMFVCPSIFPTRESVIDHLFLVIGNGYEWQNGALVYRHQFHDKRYAKLERKILRMILQGQDKKSIQRIADRLVARKNRDFQEQFSKSLIPKEADPKLRKRLNEILKSAGELPPQQDRLAYPICEYSAIMTIPADARPDWIKGWQEAVEFARKTPTHSEKDPKQNLPWVEKAVKRARRMGLIDGK